MIEHLIERFRQIQTRGDPIAGRKIANIQTINGARVQLEGGAWALVRASSNTPNLVVVCESFTGKADLRAIFADIDNILREEPMIGAYDQTFQD